MQQLNEQYFSHAFDKILYGFINHLQRIGATRTMIYFELLDYKTDIESQDYDAEELYETKKEITKLYKEYHNGDILDIHTVKISKSIYTVRAKIDRGKVNRNMLVLAKYDY